jgi:hypothetical protein
MVDAFPLVQTCQTAVAYGKGQKDTTAYYSKVEITKESFLR